MDHIWMYTLLCVIVIILIVIGLYVAYRVHMHRQYLKKVETDRELYRQVLDHLHRRLDVSEAAQQFGLEQQVSILHAVRKFTHFPLTENDRIKLLENGEEKFPDLIRMIKEAKHHLHVLYFIVRDDQIGMEILSLLQEKVKEGVEVRLLIDGVGSFRFHRSQTYSRCRRAGIKCGVFSPPKPAYWWSLNARNHRKIVIADGKVGMTGGLNIGDEYLHRDPQKGFWRDIQVLVEGEAVLLLQHIFATDWYYATGRKIAEDDRYFPQYSAEGTHYLHDCAEERPQSEPVASETRTDRDPAAAETLADQESNATEALFDQERAEKLADQEPTASEALTDQEQTPSEKLAVTSHTEPVKKLSVPQTALVQVVPSGPDMPRHTMTATFRALLNSAEHEIWLGTPYFIPNNELMRSLFAALERGVRVHIVVPKKTDHFAIQHGSIHFLKPLIQHGAHVYRYKKGFYHSKLLMADGRAAYIGSANFDRRSLQSSFEAGLNVYHKETCRRVQQIFNKDVQESDLMTLAHLRQRKWWEKAATPLSLLVARWM